MLWGFSTSFPFQRGVTRQPNCPVSLLCLAPDFPARFHAAAGDVAVGSQVVHEGAREKLVFLTKQKAFFLYDSSRKFPPDVDGVILERGSWPVGDPSGGIARGEGRP